MQLNWIEEFLLRQNLELRLWVDDVKIIFGSNDHFIFLKFIMWVKKRKKMKKLWNEKVKSLDTFSIKANNVEKHFLYCRFCYILSPADVGIQQFRKFEFIAPVRAQWWLNHIISSIKFFLLTVSRVFYSLFPMEYFVKWKFGRTVRNHETFIIVSVKVRNSILSPISRMSSNSPKKMV